MMKIYTKISDLSSQSLFILFFLVLIPPALVEAWNYLDKTYVQKDFVWYFRNIESVALGHFLVTVIVICAVVLLSVSIKRKLQPFFVVFCLIVFQIISLGIIIHSDLYHAPLGLGGIDSFFRTDVSEAVEFLGGIPTLTLIKLTFFIFSPYVFIIYVNNKGAVFLTSKLIFVKFAIFTIAVYISPLFVPYEGVTSNLYWRIVNISYASTALRFPVGARIFIKDSLEMEEINKSRLAADFNAKYNGGGADISVLILGESLRMQNMGIYGYKKNTTPRLSQMSNEVLIFKSAISPSAYTSYSVPLIFSLADTRNPELFYKQPSIMTAAKKSGYFTGWFSNQGAVDLFDKPATLIARESESTKFINVDISSTTKDHGLLPSIKKIINNATKRLFIVIHMMGSHPQYKRRYDLEYDLFKVEDYDNRTLAYDNKKILSEYDNSVLYTDAFIGKVIDIIKATNKSSWLVFTSDHGLNMFEDNVTHGHGASEYSLKVPFLIWSQGINVDLLSNNHKLNQDKEFNTENIYHSLLGLLGITSSDYNAKNDILSSNFIEKDVVVLGDNKITTKYSSLKKSVKQKH